MICRRSCIDTLTEQLHLQPCVLRPMTMATTTMTMTTMTMMMRPMVPHQRRFPLHTDRTAVSLLHSSNPGKNRPYHRPTADDCQPIPVHRLHLLLPMEVAAVLPYISDIEYDSLGS
jgi:hypothetical protein